MKGPEYAAVVRRKTKKVKAVSTGSKPHIEGGKKGWSRPTLPCGVRTDGKGVPKRNRGTWESFIKPDRGGREEKQDRPVAPWARAEIGSDKRKGTPVFMYT